ncbi:hypothetical protein OG407_35135 [Streptomyces sp. NBC_01515]|uniref:hypothetical protein n=1 Tax=Streptomyces sp. NBC_01515 TaxID=2903890 RepID=UPI0038697AAD
MRGALGNATVLQSPKGWIPSVQAASTPADPTPRKVPFRFPLGGSTLVMAGVILGFVAAVIGFTMLRTKDLRSSALSTIPPDVDEDGEVRPDDASDLPVGAPARPHRAAEEPARFTVPVVNLPRHRDGSALSGDPSVG